MAIYEFNGKRPTIGETSYIHETAQVIGDVVIGEECFIAPGAVLRGDFGAIRVGDRCSVQESCAMHSQPHATCVLGNDVTVGHGAVVHGATVGNGAVIGINATVADHARVGDDAIVAEGSVVRTGQEIPEGVLAAGVPAQVKGPLNDQQKLIKSGGAKAYAELARLYRETAKKISD